MALGHLNALPHDLVLAELQNRVSNADNQQKLNLAYGLAHFGELDVDALITDLTRETTKPQEVENILTALRHDTSASLQTLMTYAHEASIVNSWSTKARLATVALQLGDASLSLRRC